MNHVRALDGVRGIAILLVVLFHDTFLSCGWAGVQLFFVLSGYLITSILVADTDLPLPFYLKRFYWRRSLRIFPLYFGYLAILGVCYVASGHPAVFGRYWPSLVTYTLNFERLYPGFPNNAYFGHFWSLAVEEQFYLVWPLLMFGLGRRGRQILVVAMLVLCPAVRGLTAHFAAAVSSNSAYIGQAVYSFTPGQLDAFAAGAALVVFRRSLPRNQAIWFAATTAALLAGGELASYALHKRWIFDTSLGYPLNMTGAGQHIWGYTIINLWSASLILLASASRRVSDLLGNSVLVFFGRVSYGMYVLHLIFQSTINGFFGPRHGIANLMEFCVYLGILAAACHVSYRWYESHFLRLKDRRFQRPRTLAAVAGGGQPRRDKAIPRAALELQTAEETE